MRNLDSRKFGYPLTLVQTASSQVRTQMVFKMVFPPTCHCLGYLDGELEGPGYPSSHGGCRVVGSRPRHSPMLSAGDTLSFLCPHLMHFSHWIPVTLWAHTTSESRPGQGTPNNNQSQLPTPLSGIPQCSTKVLVAVVSLEDSFQGV